MYAPVKLAYFGGVKPFINLKIDIPFLGKSFVLFYDNDFSVIMIHYS